MEVLSNEKDLNDFIKSHNKCVVKFYADWCGPCRRIANLYETLPSEHTDISFAKLEMDGKDDLGIKYDIDVFPTFKFYHNCKDFALVLGANNDKLKSQLQKLKEK